MKLIYCINIRRCSYTIWYNILNSLKVGTKKIVFVQQNFKAGMKFAEVALLNAISQKLPLATPPAHNKGTQIMPPDKNQSSQKDRSSELYTVKVGKGKAGGETTRKAAEARQQQHNAFFCVFFGPSNAAGYTNILQHQMEGDSKAAPTTDKASCDACKAARKPCHNQLPACTRCIRNGVGAQCRVTFSGRVTRDKLPVGWNNYEKTRELAHARVHARYQSWKNSQSQLPKWDVSVSWKEIGDPGSEWWQRAHPVLQLQAGEQQEAGSSSNTEAAGGNVAAFAKAAAAFGTQPQPQAQEEQRVARKRKGTFSQKQQDSPQLKDQQETRYCLHPFSVSACMYVAEDVCTTHSPIASSPSPISSCVCVHTHSAMLRRMCVCCMLRRMCMLYVAEDPSPLSGCMMRRIWGG